MDSLSAVIATVLAAATVGLAAVLIGQLVCFVCGASSWSPSAPAVGLSALMLLAAPGLSLPGRSTLPFIAILALSLSGGVVLQRRPAHRPPLWGLVPVVLTSLVVLIPFIAAGRFGTLGVGVDNDMASHLLLAGAFESASIARFAPAGPLGYYPLGPHAVVGTLAAGWGISVDGAFAGFTIVLPVLTSLMVFAQLRKVPRLAAPLAAVAGAMQYLSAAYMGQGSFKELTMVVLIFGLIGQLNQIRMTGIVGRLQLVPIAFLFGGFLSVYSLPGLPWPVGIIALLGSAAAIGGAIDGGLERLRGYARALAVPSVIAAATLLVLVAPQIRRLHRFYGYMTLVGTGTGIAKNSLGNLVGPLNPFEVTGSWLNDDYRLPPADATASKVFGLVVVGLALAGLIRLVRRGQLELPAAAVVCGVICLYSNHTQSPYTAAKALVIASPFVVTLAAIEALQDRPGTSWWNQMRWGVAACTFLILAISTFQALRYSPVDPDAHELALAAFRPIVAGRTVLSFEYDEFIPWELAGADVSVPGLNPLPLNPASPWTPGERFDWDSIVPAALDSFDYVVAPNDASASGPPPNFKLVAQSGPYDLYRRVGPTLPRETLAAGDASGAVLDCATRSGRRLSRLSGIANVTPRSVYVTFPGLVEGGQATVNTPSLEPGTYKLNVQYAAVENLLVHAQGFHAQLPATLDRLGPYWPAGNLTVRQPGSIALSIAADSPPIPSPDAGTPPVTVALTPVAPSSTIPLRDACGRYVDWYRLAPQ